MIGWLSDKEVVLGQEVVLSFFFGCLMAYGVQIRAAVVTHIATPDSLIHSAGSGIDLASWHCRDTTNLIVPQ